jgi:hypothetical protein
MQSFNQKWTKKIKYIICVNLALFYFFYCIGQQIHTVDVII